MLTRGDSPSAATKLHNHMQRGATRGRGPLVEEVKVASERVRI